MKYFGGWSGSLILLIVYLASEVGFSLLGGDWAGFLFVTFHFIVMPIGSILIIILTFIKIYRERTIINRLITFCSVIIPVAIILIAASGSLITIKLFGINFNR
jgi:hypothetical protein